MSHLDDLNDLIQNHQRRLQKLYEKRAKFGWNTTPEVLNEIEDIETEIKNLQAEIDLHSNSSDESTFVAMLQACASQVDAEIASMVGKKFIPKLYVEREAQEKIDQILFPESHLLTQNPDLKELKSIKLIKDSLPSDSPLRALFDALPQELNGRIHILIARAGTGKTNLLCHLAKHYAKEIPTIFLTGRSGITERTSIKELIEVKLSRFLEKSILREYSFDQFVSINERLDKKLLIFLDAINEHYNLELLNSAIADFLLDIRGKAIVVIASCRDVYWPFFETTRWPINQWKKLELKLDLFSQAESAKAIDIYFDYYKIDATLSDEARKKIAHPLILRFFCEAYGEPLASNYVELHDISDLRLKVLFDDYLTRKLDSIRFIAPRRRRTSREIEDFLFSLADKMRHTKTREVIRDNIPGVTKQTDLESLESVYVAILGEDIIIEEEPEEKTGQINVVFVFDEFMEYMIARAMIRAHYPLSVKSVKHLVKECQNGATEFPSFVGVFEYIGIILREEHNIVIWDISVSDQDKFASAVFRAITKLEPEILGKPEILILEKTLSSQSPSLRRSAVECLNVIIIGERYEKQWRVSTAEILRKVLVQEDDPIIRGDAIKRFEEDKVASLNKTAQEIATWWKNKKEEIKSKVILFSEDDIDISKTYRIYFTVLGFDHIYCETRGNGTIQTSLEIQPSLIVTDIHKPDLDGKTMAQTLKAMPALSKVPIILCSVFGDEFLEDVPSLFCAAFTKPFDITELSRTIQMTLAGKFEISV